MNLQVDRRRQGMKPPVALAAHKRRPATDAFHPRTKVSEPRQRVCCQAVDRRGLPQFLRHRQPAQRRQNGTTSLPGGVAWSPFPGCLRMATQILKAGETVLLDGERCVVQSVVPLPTIHHVAVLRDSAGHGGSPETGTLSTSQELLPEGGPRRLVRDPTPQASSAGDAITASTRSLRRAVARPIEVSAAP